MDLISQVEEMPLPGQTIIGTDFVTGSGGKGANQAVAAALLGYPTEMVGAVGEDVFGQAMLDNLARVGVGTDAVMRVAGSSGVAPIFVNARGENSIAVIPGANGKVDRAVVDANAELIRSAGMVLCQLELPIDTVAYTLALCKNAGVPVMLDPAPAAALPDSVFSELAWITPNETEAAFYVGSPAKIEDAAKQFFDKGVVGVVLKRGGDGAYVAQAAGKADWVRPFKVDAIDTVGAGDCFNGAFAVALLEGLDPWSAARFANAAAAISVTRRGSQSSMPKRDEVDAFLKSHG
jgi:ribokinase